MTPEQFKRFEAYRSLRAMGDRVPATCPIGLRKQVRAMRRRLVERFERDHPEFIAMFERERNATK